MDFPSKAYFQTLVIIWAYRALTKLWSCCLNKFENYFQCKVWSALYTWIIHLTFRSRYSWAKAIWECLQFTINQKSFWYCSALMTTSPDISKEGSLPFYQWRLRKLKAFKLELMCSRLMFTIYRWAGSKLLMAY